MADHLNVALLWHFHQPDYVHPDEGVAVLPWVRMHGVRGYTDMLAALEAEPGARVTLNVTPVLLAQLERCVATWGGPGEDRLLSLCRRLPTALPEGERAALAALLFSANRAHMIAPLPRYLELLERCEPALKGDGRLPLSDADLLDLAVLFHLAWSGFRLRRRQEVVALLRKGRGYTREEFDQLLALHRDEIASLLPRLKLLAESGQVELSTTPDQHPILPLLCKLDSHEFPQAGGLDAPFTYEQPGDAADHVARAVAGFERRFGAPPRGMWPAEGAISEAALRELARAKLAWAASDEALLFASSSGAASSRDDLYRPHRFATPDGAIALFFRDHELSDRIGFQYQSWPAEAAVRDLVRRLDEVRGAVAHEAPVVALILDGENPWENYPGAGEPFLAALYRELAHHPRLAPVTMSEALARADAAGAGGRGPGVGTLLRVAKGSWIGGNLDTWAGQREKLDGWRLLAQARALFAGVPLAELPPAVATSLRALEGSDWYWWFGDDHFTAQRDLFEALFHAHLRVVFRAAGRDAPPLPPPDARREDLRPAREPLEAVRPRGLPTDLFEWQSAGWFELQAAGGSMTRARRVARRLLFGFEQGVLHVAVEREAKLLKGRLFFAEPRPRGFDSILDPAGWQLPWLRFEIASGDLAAAPGATLRFRLELETEEGEVLHWPGGRLARLRVPERAFEAARWYV
ncbi:MAG: glycoside hydrolase [Planctomycetes bacterium]|nr:glycoside hydrolase [Planctomycetota bacterium]